LNWLWFRLGRSCRFRSDEWTNCARRGGDSWAHRRCGRCRSGAASTGFDHLDQNIALFRLDAAELVFNIPALGFTKID